MKESFISTILFSVPKFFSSTTEQTISGYFIHPFSQLSHIALYDVHHIRGRLIPSNVAEIHQRNKERSTNSIILQSNQYDQQQHQHWKILPPAWT
jgi:hypothetical protein